MKSKKIFLELDDEEEPLTLGWIRQKKSLPLHELFFEVNRCNGFPFHRIQDLEYRNFCFARYEGRHEETQTLYHIVSNKSFHQRQKTSNELFSQIEEVEYLFPQNREIAYIMYAKDSIPDFSVILLPENLRLSPQLFSLTPQSELYKLIQYYE